MKSLNNSIPFEGDYSVECSGYGKDGTRLHY